MSVPASSIQAAPNAFAITPSDLNPLPKTVRQIRCKPTSGAAGTLKVLMADGDIFATEISVGEKLDILVTQVFATGTSATGLEGFI